MAFIFLKDTIGIDPGSQHLRIIKDGEIVFNETSQISIDKTSNTVSGFGDSSLKKDNHHLIKPVNYVIADFQAFEILLRSAINKGIPPKSIFPKSYKMYFGLPTGATEIEKRAYRDSGEHAGAIEVHMVLQSCCSALGMKLLPEVKDFILIDFGASKIEMTVFANGLIISEGAIRLGTWKIFRLLKNHFRRKYKLEIQETEIAEILTTLKSRTAEEIRIHFVSIKVEEIQEVLTSYFNLVNDELMEAIERVSNNVHIDKVLRHGVYFTGGGSTIEFLRDQIKLDSRIKRTVSTNPLIDSTSGLKQVMSDKKKYKDYLMT